MEGWSKRWGRKGLDFGDYVRKLEGKIRECCVYNSNWSRFFADREMMFNTNDSEASQVQTQEQVNADEAAASASWDELREVWLFLAVNWYILIAQWYCFVWLSAHMMCLLPLLFCVP